MRPSPLQRRWPMAALLLAAVAFQVPASAAETWRGLVVAPEHRCSPYDRHDYPYPQSVEPRIVEALGGHVERDNGAWRYEFHTLPDDDINRWIDAFADEFDTSRPH